MESEVRRENPDIDYWRFEIGERLAAVEGRIADLRRDYFGNGQPGFKAETLKNFEDIHQVLDRMAGAWRALVVIGSLLTLICLGIATAVGYLTWHDSRTPITAPQQSPGQNTGGNKMPGQ